MTLTPPSKAEPSVGMVVVKLVSSLGMIVLFWVLVVYWALPYVMGSVAAPITDSPETEWVPAVNARETDGGFVPGVWKAEFPDGTVCYSAYGLFGDDMECVK